MDSITNKAALILAGAMLAGCTQTPAYTYMANPLASGALRANRILRPDVALEGSAGLAPGTLMDEASLVVLDATRVCFQLVFRTDAAHANLANPQGWSAVLNGEPQYFWDTAPTFGDAVERTQELQKGEQATLAVSTQKLCNDDTLECRTKTRVDTGTKVVNVNVSTGGGTVCFANQGHVTAATEVLRLELQDPGSMGHRVTFVWQFVGGLPGALGAGHAAGTPPASAAPAVSTAPAAAAAPTAR